MSETTNYSEAAVLAVLPVLLSKTKPTQRCIGRYRLICKDWRAVVDSSITSVQLKKGWPKEPIRSSFPVLRHLDLSKKDIDSETATLNLDGLSCLKLLQLSPQLAAAANLGWTSLTSPPQLEGLVIVDHGQSTAAVHSPANQLSIEGGFLNSGSLSSTSGLKHLILRRAKQLHGLHDHLQLGSFSQLEHLELHGLGLTQLPGKRFILLL